MICFRVSQVRHALNDVEKRILYGVFFAYFLILLPVKNG